MKKTIGFIGLGRMGGNMVLNLLGKGYEVVGFNRSPGPTRKLGKKKGFVGAYSLEEFVEKLRKPRVVFVMVTAGKPTDDMIKKLSKILDKGDIVLEGGNTRYEKALEYSKILSKKSIHYLDVGISGGVEGALKGQSIMVGGDRNVFNKVEPVFRDLAAKDGYAYLGKTGAGHFVKTIHNGIEYGLLQAYAEGFEILKKSPYDYDMRKVAKVWNNGSIVRSRILELAEKILEKDPKLKKFKGKIGGGETGRWTHEIAKKEKVDNGVLRVALKARKKSMKKQTYGTKFISANRHEFGGHEEPK